MSTTASLDSQSTIDLFNDYVIPNYTRYPVSLVRGEGSRVWDAEGHEYLDLFPGWGCNILGYSPPAVVEAIQQQAARLIHVPNTWYIEQQGRFAEFLCSRSFGKAFFCNSGAEANEAAIKLARLHGSADGRFRLITFEKGFHGRTFAALAATAQPKYHEGLGPLVAGFRYAAINDLDGVRKLVDDETCGIMIEPVQGEGGVRIPDPEFLQGLRNLCDEHGMLLIFDEVQTGMGRTGEWFGYQHTGIEPDVITMAKGIAGGVACGAMITKNQFAADLRPGMHASTFGGNSLAMAAGLATGETIEREGLLQAVQENASYIRERLEECRSSIPIIKELRICGMMIGIDLTVPSTPAVGKAMDRGVLLNATQDTVVRLLPAMNITREELNKGLDVVIAVLREMAETE
ncbi:MAG: aspartate aminotransferase family protein [Fuerstiella sp.]|nr:aspartate aminotransferase family protein [Fuerstiella sp.]MCP4506015.1 aspartate aminotransferase family protein [Fuerstiella sp.]MDG2131441.1 aspartate aminotransferase family protein [Fuerstiella sp.]